MNRLFEFFLIVLIVSFAASAAYSLLLSDYDSLTEVAIVLLVLVCGLLGWWNSKDRI